MQIRVVREKRRPFRIDDPTDLQMRPGALEQVDRWERVDDVAQRTRLDHKDRPDIRRRKRPAHLPSASLSASLCGKPASTILSWARLMSYSMRRNSTYCLSAW